MHMSPFAWIASGFTVAIAGFYFSLAPAVKLTSSEGNFTNILPKVVGFTVYTLLALFLGSHLHELFVATPISESESDVIPSIQLYVTRFLDGEVVYRPLYFQDYKVDPTYLPLLWLPYVFSEGLQIDYRWTPYALFLIALLWYQFRLLKQELNLFEHILKTAIPFIWVYIIFIYDPIQFQLAVELVPVGFYLLLTLTVNDKRPLVVGLGILGCLLSRYAFTFWLPVYMLIYWAHRGFSKTFWASFTVLIGVLGIYIIPFLSKDWSVFAKGLAYYEKTAKGEWQRQPWQAPGDKPYYLSRGMSLAIHFYDYPPYTLEDRLKFNRKVHITACAITALLILLGYFLFRNRIKNLTLYLLAALKLYLVVFYGLFYVPFDYLYQLPLLMSIPILYQIRLSPRGMSRLILLLKC